MLIKWYFLIYLKSAKIFQVCKDHNYEYSTAQRLAISIPFLINFKILMLCILILCTLYKRLIKMLFFLELGVHFFFRCTEVFRVGIKLNFQGWYFLFAKLFYNIINRFIFFGNLIRYFYKENKSVICLLPFSTLHQIFRTFCLSSSKN